MPLELPFIGRSSELQTLNHLLTRAQDGHPALALISGEPGVGKTSILDILLTTATDAGLRVGRARGARMEGGFAFGVVRQIFDSLLAADPDSDELMRDAGRPANTVLDHEQASHEQSVHAEFDVHHALYRLLTSVAQRSAVVLAVDDAHLADAPSLRYLAYALRRCEPLPVLMVLCTTDGDSPVAEEPLHDLVSVAHHLPVQALSRQRVTQLVRCAATGEVHDDICHAFFTVTQGNPFLLKALLYRLRSRLDSDSVALTPDLVRQLGSITVSERVNSRLRLLPDASALARAVAVLGADVDFSQATALAGIDLPSAADALDDLVHMRILSNNHPLTFTHSFVRDAIVEGIPLGTRIAEHSRAAELLYRASAPDEQVAAHLVNSGTMRHPWAVELLRRTAVRAYGRGAPDIAATYLRHALGYALSQDERAAVLAELGRAELAVDPGTGITRLRAALSAAVGDHESAAVALTLVPALSMMQAHEEAVAAADRAVDHLDGNHADLGWTLNITAMMASFMRMDTVDHAWERATDVLKVRPQDPRLQRSCWAMRSMLNAWRGTDREQVVRWGRLALNGADLRLFGPPHYYYGAVYGLIYADELTAARQAAEQAERLARESGALRVAALAMLVRGTACLADDDLAKAEELLREALAGFDDCGVGAFTDAVVCVARLVETLISLGETVEAQELIAARDLSGELPEQFFYNFLLCARGRLRVTTGETDTGIKDLLECGRRATRWRVTNPVVLPWRSRAALALAATGEFAEAERLAEADLIAAHEWGTPRAVGVALHAVAVATDEHRHRAAGLTKQEQRAASLAAQGIPNKRIAQELHVSLRCVELHLSGAYRKLGIAGRRELASALGVRPLGASG